MSETPDISLCDLASAIREQDRVMGELSRLVSEVGAARALREVSSDLRKKILSRIMSPMLTQGDSAAAAESHARATREYHEQIEDHVKALANAETIITRAEVLKMQAEAISTKISMQKAILNLQ